MKKADNKAIFEERKLRITKLLRKLKMMYPHERRTILEYSNNWELMVAVQLSAQCTDERVNIVTKDLFKKYKTLQEYANTKPEVFARDIKSISYPNNKARNIVTCAKKIKDEFDGELPETMEEMLTLPGVARKTANVVLGNAYGVVEGIAVDTHVKRFVKRFDLSDHATPEKIERDLMELLPKKEWYLFTYYVIAYGRDVGRAVGYKPDEDPLVGIYTPRLN